MGNWLMPYLSAITPSYVEGVLRGGYASNHVAMFQLFDLMWDTDSEIRSCIGEYVEGVLSKRIIVEPYHEEEEEPTESAMEKARLCSAALRNMRPDPAEDENDLRGTIKDLLAARFFGHSVLEIDWYDTYGTGELNLKEFDGTPALFPRSTYWVNPLCYTWNVNGRLGLRVAQKDIKSYTQNYKQSKQAPEFSEQYISSGLPSRTLDLFEMPDCKFLVGVDKGKTGSIWTASELRSLAWWWLAKNFCGDYLMKNAELFGVPFRKATYDSSVQEPLKAEVRQLLQAMGSTGWALLPKGVELDFDKSVNQGGESPAAFLFNLANGEIRKAILRQTMTGGSHDSMGKGGGKAFGETEKDVKSACINSGATYVESVINFQFIPYILKRNYGDDTEAPTILLQDEKVGGLPDAQRDQILVQLFDVGEDAMRRKYDLPKPKPGESLCGQDTGAAAAQAKQAQDLQKSQMAERAKADATARAQASSQQAKVDVEETPQQTEAKRARGIAVCPNCNNDFFYNKRAEIAAGAVNCPVCNQTVFEIKAASGTVAPVADALAETIQPAVKRLKAIDEISDPATQKEMLSKFLKDLPALAKALKHDKSLNKQLTAAGVLQFVSGLKQSKPQ